MDRFTGEQANRMRCAIVNYRETLVGGGSGPGGPGELTNGVPETGLSGATGSETFFTLDVPSGASEPGRSTCRAAAGTPISTSASAAQPTTRRPTTAGPYLKRQQRELRPSPSPSVGTYHVMIRGFSAYSGVSLVGSYTDRWRQLAVQRRGLRGVLRHPDG